MEDYKKLIKELVNIGIAFSAEKNTESLLKLILTETMSITSSDAGSLYIVEEKPEKKVLRFKISENHSRIVEFTEFPLNIDKNSIAGYVALSKKPLVLQDVTNIPSEIGIKYNDSFDKKINYKTVNMLVIPMLDYNENVVGVLQLINKKKGNDLKLKSVENIPDQITDYIEEEQEIVNSLASQAAILIERAKLYNDIEVLFQSFIEAMVAALDARDPTTCGHSKRLALLSVGVGSVINNTQIGKYANISFSNEELREFYYAALLHDIGKIGVKEHVLLKQNRLTDERLTLIRYRFHYYRERLEIQAKESKINPDEESFLENFDEILNKIETINSKNFLKDDELEELKKIHAMQYVDIDGKKKNILDEFEFENLSIVKGNLTKSERDVMESHVKHSFDLLTQIHWTSDLLRVPEIAATHHEKIDGSGYSQGLVDEQISVQAKILAILDIFEALTAVDRPYRPALTPEKAIGILENMVKDGQLDGDLLTLFVENRVWEHDLESYIP